ncbi:MAG: hypothetical protein WCG80_01010 [Spirochaetales bacterium]
MLGFLLPSLLAGQPQAPVLALAVSPDSRWLATGSLSGQVKVRDLRTGELVHAGLAPAGVRGLSFESEFTLKIALSGRLQASWSFTGPHAVELDSLRFVAQPLGLPGTESDTLSMSENKDLSLVAAVRAIGVLEVRGTDGNLRASVPFAGRQVVWLGDALLVVSVEGDLVLWSSDLKSPGTPLMTGVTALASSGQHWVAGTRFGELWTGERETSAAPRHWKSHQGTVNAVAWGSPGHFVSAGGDSQVILWDAATGRKLGNVSP